MARGWYKARNRVLERMSEISGREILRWTPHDMRRTARSNTKRMGVDFETAEAMLNHTKQGLERIYDGYALENEKRAWFLAWEEEILRIARENGVADSLGAPASAASSPLPLPSLAATRRRRTTTIPSSPSRRGPPRA